MRWNLAAAALVFLSLETAAFTSGGSFQQDSAGQPRQFTLYVREGWFSMPDGSQVWVWGFTDDPRGPAKVPGPPIVVNEGDEVEVTLINDRDPTTNALIPFGEGHTIHLHGLDTPTEHDGVPETFAPGLVRQGGAYTYRFKATHAGTYFYHCHQNNVEHQQMGMFGALAVKAAGGMNTAYTGGPAFDREQTLVLAEIGAEGHEQARRAIQEGGEPYNWLRYTPDYWLINDRGHADPQDVSVPLDLRPGERLLVRAINAGYVAHEVHAHGQPFQVVGSDGRGWPAGATTDTVWVGPGEKYDLLFTGGGQSSVVLHDHVDGLYAGPAVGAEELGAAQASPQRGEPRSFTFYVREGSQTMPDGARISVYGFTDDPEGPAKVPGPVIAVDEGDTVELTLINDRDPTGTGHGLDFPGLEVQAEGSTVAEPGGSAVYRFVADRAGSYLYRSAGGFGDQQMGGYGAMVVGTPGGANTAYTGGPSFDQEYTMVLSEMDSSGHEQARRAVEEGRAYDWPSYKPNYFLINGLAYPDTAEDWATTIRTTPGEQVLIRAINAGGVPHAMHLHGYHFQPVARAGRPWPGAPWKDTILMAPGESYDLLFPVLQPGVFPFHDHYETANTNDGVWLGGMHTMVVAGTEEETLFPAPGPVLPEGPLVAVRDNFYSPNTLTVPVGTTVVWEHQGRVEHTVTSLLGSFDSGVLSGGDVFTHTFDEPGRYDYFCRFHITNRGVIIVEDTSAAEATPPGGGVSAEAGLWPPPSLGRVSRGSLSPLLAGLVPLYGWGRAPTSDTWGRPGRDSRTLPPSLRLSGRQGFTCSVLRA